MIKTLNNAYCRAYSLAPPLLYDKKMIISCVALSIICVVGAALAATYLPLLGACFVASFLLSAAAYASISALVGIIFAAIGRPQHRVNSKQMGQSSDSSSPKEPKSSTSHDVSKANVAVVRNGQHKLSKDIEELKTKNEILSHFLKLYLTFCY